MGRIVKLLGVLVIVLACCSFFVHGSDTERSPKLPSGDTEMLEVISRKDAELAKEGKEEMARSKEEMATKDRAIAALTAALEAKADRATQVQVTPSGDSLEVPTAARVKALEKRLEAFETRLGAQDATIEEGHQQIIGKALARSKMIEAWAADVMQKLTGRLTKLEELYNELASGSRMHPGRALSEGVAATAERASLIVEARSDHGVADVVMGGDGEKESVVLRKRGPGEGSLFTMTRGNESTTTPALSMDLDGNVGIGTASPECLLHVQAAGMNRVRIEGTGSSHWAGGVLELKAGNVSANKTFGMTRLAAQSSQEGWAGFWLQRHDSSGIWKGHLAAYQDALGWRMYTAASSNATDTKEALRITPDGSIGIGTASPGASLDVAGHASVSGVLSAAEMRVTNLIQAIDVASTGALQAVGAEMSSTGYGRIALQCIDGDVSSASRCHTLNGANEWLSIDLGGERNIRSVDVYNRDDNGCGTRLGAFELWLGNTSGATTALCGTGNACTSFVNCPTTWCHGPNYPGSYMNELLGIPCVGTARFVTLRLASAGGDRHLNLREVVVKGVTSAFTELTTLASKVKMLSAYTSLLLAHARLPVIFDRFDSAYVSTTPGALSKIAGGSSDLTGLARASFPVDTSAGIAVTFTCPATNVGRYFGFVPASYQTSGTITSNSYAALMPYAYLCKSDGNVYVYEGGTHKGTFGPYTSTTMHEIRLHPSGQVDYLKDGGIIYTSATINIVWPLYVGASMYTQAASTLTNVQYAALPPPPTGTGPVIFDRFDGAYISATPGALSKIGGGTNWNTGSAARASYPIEASAGIAVTFTCSSTSEGRFIGFVPASYQTSGTYTGRSDFSLPYGYYCSPFGNVGVREGMTWVDGFGAYTSTTVHEIRLHPSGQVDYAKDGVVFYNSSTTNTQWPLYVGASMQNQAASTLTNVQYASLGS